MTRNEAIDIVAMVVRSWPASRPWTKEEMEAYAAGIERLNADTAVKAVAAAQQHLTHRPSVAELRDFYFLEGAKIRAAEEKPSPWPTKRETVPLWVRRWVAARYLHRMFGKDQDMRRFPEQGDWGNPYMVLMPDDAWLDEAAHVTEDRVWHTLRG